MATLHLEEGKARLAKGQYPRAISHLHSVLKTKPNSYEAWGHLGIAYFHRGKHRMAETAFKRALKINPKYGDARNNLGLMYVKLGRLAEAKKTFQQNLEDLEYEDQAFTYFNLGNLYIQKKQYLKARYFFKKSTEENPNYCQSWFRLSEIATRLSNTKDSEYNLRKASSGLCYRFPLAHYQLGKLLLRQRKYKSAEKKFSEIIKKFPKTDVAHRSRQHLKNLPMKSKKM